LSCEENLKKRVLVIYYSFTQQTHLLLKKFCSGLENCGLDIQCERLQPVEPYEFPLKSDLRLASVMMKTFFRMRNEIKPVSEQCYKDWDYIVLAGPTWSYHPSGPMLDFMDRFGKSVLRGKKVIPFISCRSYWRIHHLTIKRMLIKCEALPMAPLVFQHPTKEPYRFIGLLLQLRGRVIRGKWFRKHYAFYGHSKAQSEEAYHYGETLGKSMVEE
jgi:hypothetical protein